ncbi:MAG: GGDEF domain-containing protein [Nitrospirae bacterium]|nr:GGDEF domain-containing protein [Nitrospirota bacterium]
MGLFGKKKDPELLEREELTERLEDCEERRELFILAMRTLIIFLKDFSFDIKELDAGKYKEELDYLGEKLTGDDKTKKLAGLLEKSKDAIVSFIKRKKLYYGDREAELKNIIDLLSRGIVTLNTENIDFNARVYEQSERIGKITLLDDIRKIKSEIKSEVEHMQQAIQQKQLADSKQIELLVKEVKTLKDDLEKAQKTSMLDGLTSVYNRMSFDKYIVRIVDKATVENFSFSLFMIDIDNFKKINDTYGHQVGDRVILAMTEKCKEHIRQEDFFARYGGEEFVIVLPKASIKNALIKAEDMRESIAKARYSLGNSKQDIQIGFTVSIGISVFSKGDKVSTIIERADKSLYAAKRSGKNKVVTEKDI